MKSLLPGPRIRVFAWALLIPVLGLMLTWAHRTIDMYQLLALRNLGDERLGGMSLQRAAELQFYYLRNEIIKDISRAVARDPDDALPRIHLFIQNSHLEQLDSELPRSGFEYVDGYLLNGGDFDKVKVRYRGDFAYHWGLFKKSFRVKTKKDKLFHGMRKFNLNAPKSSFLYGNHFGYVMAREVGLLAPASALVNVSVNGEDRGLHLLVEQPGETFLRNAGRLPGDIYKGDQTYGDEVWYGLDAGLFETAGFWEKMSHNNRFPEPHNEPLQALLEALREPDEQALSRLLDLEAFARLNLWEQLANSRHIDNEHNWRLYYDPGLGKFEPILWDGMPWSEIWNPTTRTDAWSPPEKIIASRLMAVLHDHPAFVRIKHRVFAEFISGDAPDRLIEQLRELNVLMGKVAQDELMILNEFNIRVPPDEAIARMAVNVTLLERIVDAIRTRYQSPGFAQPPGQEPLSREDQIPGGQVWDGLVEITTDTVITTPVVMTPGTRVRVHEGKSLFFRNRLTVNGTEAAPVTVQPVPGSYFGAMVIEGEAANGSVLSWLTVSGGSGHRNNLREYSGMLSIHNVRDVQMTHCHLLDNHTYDDQLHLVYASASISECVFENAPFDAIDLDMSEVTFERSHIVNNGNDGIDLMGSRVDADDLVIEGNRDKGLSVGERSTLSVRSSRIRNNEIGIQIKDDSIAVVQSAVITGNAIGIDAYKKNWRYSNGGYGVVCDSMFSDNGQDLQQDRNSLVRGDTVLCPVGQSLDKDQVSRLRTAIGQTRDNT